MQAIIRSMEDAASKNIIEKLLSLGEWVESHEFNGSPTYINEEKIIVTINDRHIFREELDAEIIDTLGIDIDVMIYASRHTAASGKKTLTVHPLGNFHDAKFGGEKETLVPAAPHLMTQALRQLAENARDITDYGVSFEVTHHGPRLETPTFYIEIGSSESDWGDERAGEAIAKTLSSLEAVNYPVAIGVGGGHYAPRFSEVVLKNKISMGHMIPNYAIEGIKNEMYTQALEKSSAELVYIHRKSMKKPLYRKLKQYFESLDLMVVREKDLEDL